MASDRLTRFYHNGHRAPASGQYAVYTASGERVPNAELTMPAGHKFPPYRLVPNAQYLLVDPTQHARAAA